MSTRRAKTWVAAGVAALLTVFGALGATSATAAPRGNTAPIGSVDAISVQGGVVTVRGWALDPDTTASIPVHVFVGSTKKIVTADAARSDIARIHGKGAAHGYSVAVPVPFGTYQVCVYAIDSVNGPPSRLACRTTTVKNSAPVGSIDAVSTSPGTVTVSGWALDPDTEASVPVHVYVGSAKKIVVADSARSDIARIYGRGAAHGYSVDVPVANGTYQVCAYAIDSINGPPSKIGCRPVTVANKAPIGSLDSVTVANGTVSVRGWALDPDTDASVPVHVYVGSTKVVATAAASRTDVGRAYGRGDAHGYSVDVPVAEGTYDVCVFVIDSINGPPTKLTCRSVTVANKAPIGSFDAVTTTATSVTVEGWALDPDTTESLTVRVYVDDVVTSAVASSPRSDIARIYGQGDAHGFRVTVPAEAGSHQVCVYAVDPDGGPATLLGCKSVSIEGAFTDVCVER